MLQLLARNLFRPHARVEALAKRYEEILTLLKLRDLPPAPRFVFCATDFLRSVPWTFERDRMGDRQLGVGTPSLGRHPRARRCRLVLLSALHQPSPGHRSTPLSSPAAWPCPDPARDTAIRHLALGDGATDLHLGLDPVWKSHTTVLVSEAGAYPKAAADEALLSPPGPVSPPASTARARRSAGAASSRASSAARSPAPSGASPAPPRATASRSATRRTLARDVLCTMRAGLDLVTDAEAAVLLNHGYLTADAALRTHASLASSPGSFHSFRFPSPAGRPRTRTSRDGSGSRLPGARGRRGGGRSTHDDAPCRPRAPGTLRPRCARPVDRARRRGPSRHEPGRALRQGHGLHGVQRDQGHVQPRRHPRPLGLHEPPRRPRRLGSLGKPEGERRVERARTRRIQLAAERLRPLLRARWQERLLLQQPSRRLGRRRPLRRAPSIPPRASTATRGASVRA